MSNPGPADWCRERMPIVFSGLPSVGKTTIARKVARSLAAVYLRIDSIEQALREAGLDVKARC
jgi:predicted kinase